MKRSLHAFALVFALLLAQAGAAAHALSHAAGHGGDKGLASDVACELCVGYAQLAGAAPQLAQAALPACAAAFPRPETAAAVFFTRTVLHSRARAPPTFS